MTEEIGDIKLVPDGDHFARNSMGTRTEYFEISREEYDRIRAIDNYRGKLNLETEAKMSRKEKGDYGFYGANITEDTEDGKCYFTKCYGIKCE